MIQLTYSNIEPDDFRVYDGRKLAQAMLADAYRLLIPYVQACPACADHLFTVIANEAINEIHKEEGFRGYMLMAGPEDENMKRLHIEAAKALTAKILERFDKDDSNEKSGS